MRKRLRLAVCALVPAILSVLLTAAPVQAATAVDYVALGDSYSSGTGSPPYTSGALCLRSPRSYAQLWANTHAVSSFAFVACGGATTQTMSSQFLALNAGTDLVTITIGGNDVGFADTMVTCVLGSDADCVESVDSGVENAETVLPGRLDSTYATIRSRAPGAKVVVLGYPRLVEPNGTCLSAAKRTALNRGADLLDAIIAARAAAAGFRYVDPRAQFAGHGACGSAPWINSFSVLALVESFHPNTAGYARGYLPVLNGATG